MLKLVIAKDYECHKVIKLEEGSYHDLCLITSKYVDSNDIRKHYKKEYDTFYRAFKDKGDVVIVDTINNKRYRVLYKDDIKVVLNLIMDQSFMRYVVKGNFLDNLSQWDKYIIMGRKNSSYAKHLRDYLKSRKDSGDYFKTIRTLEVAYEYYRTTNKNLKSLDSLKRESKKSREEAYLKRLKTLSEKKELELLRDSITVTPSTNVYEEIHALDMDEIYCIYSLDDLLTDLNPDECKKLKIGAYKK